MPKLDTKKVFSFQRLLASLGLAVLIFVSLAGPLAAQTVTQGYRSDEPVQRGMIVATREDDSNKVVPISDANLDRILGIVVQPNDSPVTLSTEESKVFVANTGTYETLVSDEGGPIKIGDFISISSGAGIGMKAGEDHSLVVGRAAANFDGSSDTAGTAGEGDKKVRFGRILVTIAIGPNPLSKPPEKDRVPDALQKIARTVAEKPVTDLRIYLALAILAATSILAGTTLYSGVRSSIVSIGRNPLSKATIYKGLIQVILMSLIIFLSGLFGVYLLLKL